MWDIKQRGANKTKNKLIDADNRMLVTRGERGQGEDKEGKEAQIDGGRRRQDFWW